jgi:iron complex transport system permease protein
MRRVPGWRWLLGLALLLLAVQVALAVGPADGIGLSDVWSAVRGAHPNPAVNDIVRTVRLPRVLLGLLVGAALSISGAIFQALLRNELAEPYLIGVGPGALLGVTVAAMLGAGGVIPADALRGVLAFAGAVGVAIVVFSFARRGLRRPAVTVLLAGVAVGATVHAIASGMLYTLEDWPRVVRWLLGDLGLAEGRQVVILGVVTALGGSLAWLRARDLDVLTLGEEAAWYTGVDVRRTLWLHGGVGCLLAATAVAQCGLVGFVGLVVPHIGRRLFGSRHRVLIPASALLGGGLLVLADALARTLHAPQGLPLAVVTAALGAPVLAVLVLRRVGG